MTKIYWFDNSHSQSVIHGPPWWFLRLSGICKFKTICILKLKYYFPFALCWHLYLGCKNVVAKTIGAHRSRQWHQTIIVVFIVFHCYTHIFKKTPVSPKNALDEAVRIAAFTVLTPVHVLVIVYLMKWEVCIKCLCDWVVG